MPMATRGTSFCTPSPCLARVRLASCAGLADRQEMAAKGEPGKCRPAISQPILQAALSVALLWSRSDWALVTVISFLCMLHPAELVPLYRQDLALPEDAPSGDPIAKVHIRHPKTQRLARRQPSRIDDPFVVRLLSAHFGRLSISERLCRGSVHTYHRQWNAVMKQLGVPCALAEKGATPGVLRGSRPRFFISKLKTSTLSPGEGNGAK